MRDLQHVETKFGLQVRGGRVRIRNRVAVLSRELGIDDRDCEIGRQRMADRVRLVVRQDPERECVFLRGAGLGNQAADEVAAANVVQQIGEEPVAERKYPRSGRCEPPRASALAKKTARHPQNGAGGRFHRRDARSRRRHVAGAGSFRPAQAVHAFLRTTQPG